MANSRSHFEEAIESWEAAGKGKPNFHRFHAKREANKILLAPIIEVGLSLLVASVLLALTFSGITRNAGGASGIALLFTFWLGKREWEFRKSVLAQGGGKSKPISQFSRLHQVAAKMSRDLGVTGPNRVRVFLGSGMYLTPHLIGSVFLTKRVNLHIGIRTLLRFDLEEIRVLLFILLASSRQSEERIGTLCNYAYQVSELRLGPSGFPLYHKIEFISRWLTIRRQRMTPNWILMQQQSIGSAQKLAAETFGTILVLKVIAKELTSEELHMRQFPHSGEGQFHPDDLSAFVTEYDFQAALELLKSRFSEDLLSVDEAPNLRRLARNLGLEGKRGDSQWLEDLARFVCAPPMPGALYELFGENSQSILDSISLEAQESIRILGEHKQRAESVLEEIRSTHPDENSKNRKVWAAEEFLRAKDYGACLTVCDQALQHFPGDRDLIRFKVLAMSSLRDPGAEDLARASLGPNDLCTLWSLKSLQQLSELRGDTDVAREFEFEVYALERELEEIEVDLANLRHCMVRPLDIDPERSRRLLHVLAQNRHLNDVFLVEIRHPKLEVPVKRAYFFVIPSNFQNRLKEVAELVRDSITPLLPEIAVNQFFVVSTSSWFDQNEIHSKLKKAGIPQFYRPKLRRKILHENSG